MNKSIKIKVCAGTRGIATGGLDVIESFRRFIAKKELEATIEGKLVVHRVGCRGACARDVLVDVIINGEKTTYQFIKPDMVERIIDEHLIKGTPVLEWLVKKDYHIFYEKQQRVALSLCGEIDPEDIESYIEAGGYRATEKVFRTMSPLDVIEEIKNSGLRGRGGAGFPTALKWKIARNTSAEEKYIICNADEGDPGAFMNRTVIEGNPHSVIEGMLIGGYAIGANRGYVYIKDEYALAAQRLNIAIEQARKKNFLGRNILWTDFHFDIKIKLGSNSFVCEEETALIASIEGKRGIPRPRPPFPVNKGLFGKPTVVNNVETLVNIPHIITKGAQWFASLGTENSKGTKVFALAGKVKNTGLVEVPMGITLREIIFDIGEGIIGDKHFKAVQTGGPSGGCIPEELLDMPVDFDSLTEVGSMMGSGGMVVMDEDTCMVDVARYFLSFIQSQSCGKCVPCRVGTKRLLEILERITSGIGKPEDLEKLERLSQHIKVSSLCCLGQTAPNPVLSTLKYFRDEFHSHVFEKQCNVGMCKDLLR